jgi:tetratricopeptide (TPR) repeat protein
LWGYRSDLNLLYQPLSLQDLLEKPEKPSGARIFVESLGEARQSFIRSMTAQDLRELLAVEQEIAASPPLMHSAEAGGIIHYQNYYPNDGFLRLWSGLILHQQGRFAEAALEYAAAIKLGCKHWRVVWYLARSAEKAGDLLAAEKALQFVLQAAPDFAEAQEMSQRLTKAGRDYQSTLHEIKSLMETDGSAEASASSSPVSTNTLANEVAEALHVLNSDVERQPVLPQNEASDRETNRVNLIIDFNDLKVGQRVKVKGKLSESGAFVAQKISVKEPEEESAIEGLIRNIDFQRNILYLLNGEVALPEGIEIKGLQQDMISAKELKTGDRVKLKGKHSPRTGFTPEKIKLQENAAFQMEELQGDIDKIDREKKILEVIGFTVRVDEKTIFL